MLTAEAQIRTERPSRYLVQLCQHLNHKGRHLRHRPPPHLVGAAQPPPEVQAHVEWSDTDGILSLSCGQCTMQATPGTLTLRVEATDEESLQRIQDLVAGHLERFGRRDHLTVNWRGSPHRSHAHRETGSTSRAPQDDSLQSSQRIGRGRAPRSMPLNDQ